jgi:hypothetical protein
MSYGQDLFRTQQYGAVADLSQVQADAGRVLMFQLLGEGLFGGVGYFAYSHNWKKLGAVMMGLSVLGAGSAFLLYSLKKVSP